MGLRVANRFHCRTSLRDDSSTIDNCRDSDGKRPQRCEFQFGCSCILSGQCVVLAWVDYVAMCWYRVGIVLAPFAPRLASAAQSPRRSKTASQNPIQVRLFRDRAGLLCGAGQHSAATERLSEAS